MSVRVRVLGPLEVRVDDQPPVPLPGQLSSLLTALALLREPVDKAELARSVLFISPRTIDSRLSRLRRALGRDTPVHRVTAARSGRIELDRTVVSVDVDDFVARVATFRDAAGRHDQATAEAALRAADELWRSPPDLSMLPTNKEPHSVFLAAQHLVTIRRELCREGVAMMLAGELRLDLAALVAWSEEHPAESSIWFGRTVATFDRHGVDAATQVLDLWKAATNGGAERCAELLWATRLVRTGVRRKAGPDDRQAPEPSGSRAGVGPAATRVARWLDDVAAGATSSFVITGAAGSGKSTLLGHVGVVARGKGMRVLECDAEAMGSTHAIVRTLVAPLWEDVLRTPRPPAALLEDADVASALASGSEPGSPLRAREPSDASGRAIRVVAELLRFATRRGPVLVVVDNLQAAGPDLTTLVSALDEQAVPGVGLLVARRDDASAWTRDRDGDERTIHLEREDTDSHDVDVPIELDDEVYAALLTQPTEVRRALAIAALASHGDQYDEGLVVAIAPDVEPALRRELLRGQLVHQHDGIASFADPRLREVAYNLLDPSERRQLHGHAVEILDGQIDHSSDPSELGALASQLASHAERSDLSAVPRARALHALTRAAASAGPLDSRNAAALLERALDFVIDDRERVGLLMQRARLRWASADWDGAEGDLAAIVVASESGVDPVVEADALLLAAWLTWDPSRAGGTLGRRIERLRARLPSTERLLRARIDACLAGGLYQDGSTPGGVDAPELARAALGAVESHGTTVDPLVEAEIVWWARKGLLDVDPPECVSALSARLRSLATTSHHHRANALLASCVDHLVLGQVPTARRSSDDYDRLAEKSGSPVHQYVAATLRGLWALHDGEYDTVDLETARAEQLGSPFGGVTVTQVVEGQRILARRDQGVFRAEPALVEVVEAFSPVDGPIPIWAAASAWLRAEIGDVDLASERLEAVARRTGNFRRVPRGPHRVAFLAFAAETLERLHWLTGGRNVRRCELAQSVRSALVDHPAEGVLLGWPVAYLGPKQHFVGLACAAAGDDDAALTNLRVARRRSKASSPVNIRAQVAMARALARLGDPGQARRLAKQAADRAGSIGLRGAQADALEIVSTL